MALNVFAALSMYFAKRKKENTRPVVVVVVAALSQKAKENSKIIACENKIKAQCKTSPSFKRHNKKTSSLILQRGICFRISPMGFKLIQIPMHTKMTGAGAKAQNPPEAPKRKSFQSQLRCTDFFFSI
ncbi:hypothetical protein TNCT_261501 [Trichonephila clavata]|uniref:Uncharacterized protein n=1 Tax=Trichonephila clavata TaxID=2740835 RepID=A0A8X6I0E8_TRICU|nr:hypothetical protein TNCT_261501 [Trichonephila clavata]